MLIYIYKETRPIFTTETPGTCPGPEWLTFGNNCYRIERIPRSYPEAKFDCSIKGLIYCFYFFREFNFI